MSYTIKNEQGIEETVFTAQELEAQKQEALERYKVENPDKSGELNELQQKLADAEKALAGFQDKDLNFKNLRAQKEAAEAKIADITKEIDAKISLAVNSAKKEVLDGVMKEHYQDTLKALAGGDEELKKKIEFQYNRLVGAAGTKEEVSSKLRDAWVLASKPAMPDALNSAVLSSGGVGFPNVNSQGAKFTADEKTIGAKLGLSEEDFKKFGGQQ